jgi:hypothetical protein
MSKKTIEATMPGIFYRRPEPDQDFYVTEGASVSEGDIVGLILGYLCRQRDRSRGWRLAP